jgi:serine protease
VITLHGWMVILLGSLLLAPLTFASLPQRLIIHEREATSSDVIVSAIRGDHRGEQIQKTRIRHIKEHETIEEVAQQFLLDPNVKSVEIDVPMQHFGISPQDQFFHDQWGFKSGDGGANFDRAWEVTKGSSQIVVAVIDTGITNHPDLNDKVLPGYNFISDAGIAGNGVGRTSDATDLGDFPTQADPCFNGWSNQSSSWHGTHVAGTIAASTNNGLGVAGGDWHARILPVRVLGKCGGYMSDIADGVRWAAGGSVAGVPQNPHPARVINLSLGGFGQCGQSMQNAIDFSLSQGAVVVVAAGNDAVNLNHQSIVPANCKGVITVGASNRFGSRAGYSNFGLRVDLMAPGGDQHGGILSTHNQGQQTIGTPSYRSMTGTSMAAPHVAAAASLILSLNRNFPPLQVKDILMRSTKSFPTLSCDLDRCGTGLLDAEDAVHLAYDSSIDSSFGVIAPIQTDNSNDQTPVNVSGKGGGCGTIDLNGGSGPSGGMFIFTLMGLIFIAMEKKKRSLSWARA